MRLPTIILAAALAGCSQTLPEGFIARDISPNEKRAALLHELDNVLCVLVR